MQLEDSVVQQIEAGKKVSAIKELRQLRGIGLKEAKELVDQYEQKHDIQSFPSQKVSGVPLLPIIIVVIIAVAAYTYFS